MLVNQFMSNINIYAMFKCLYLCEKTTRLLGTKMGLFLEFCWCLINNPNNILYVQKTFPLVSIVEMNSQNENLEIPPMPFGYPLLQ